MPREKAELIAAIDVGSNAIRMIVSQVAKNGKIMTVDDLNRPTHMGRDTFTYGRIQVDSIHDACEALKGFKRLLSDYRIKSYRAVCTSGIREAQNREYVLEQIRISTGINVEVINNAQERFLMLKAVRDYMNGLSKSEKDTIIVHIGSGGVEISGYTEKSLKFTEYVKLGSLRLKEMLSELEQKTLDFPSIMEEFIECRLDFLEPIVSKMHFNSFIGLGGELKTIVRLCSGSYSETGYLDKKSFKDIYSKLRSLTSPQIVDEFGLSRNQAGILLPSVLLLNSFLDMTDAKGIHAPMVSLRHGLIIDMADKFLETNGRESDINDIISSVWHFGSKYSIDKVHCEYMEKMSLAIFDHMEKIHRLGENERLYLRIASIIHDAGKYVNQNTHDIHSYNIVRFLDIMGLSDSELNIVANIVRYHSYDIPDLSDENYYLLGPKEQIIVSKLAVILRIAESLDITHKQKIKKLEIHASGKELHFDIWAQGDILLEEWSFLSHATFFEEVMGYKPVLRLKGGIKNVQI